MIRVWFGQNINELVLPQKFDGSLFTGDELIKIGVTLHNNGVLVGVPTPCTSEWVLPDGTVIALTVQVDDCRAWVELTAACLAQSGLVTLTIRADGQTILCCSGYVHQTATDEEADDEDDEETETVT